MGLFDWLNRDPEVAIVRPKRRRLDARGKLVFWALVFGAAIVIVYLATSAKGQTPTTHKVPSVEAFEQLRTDNDNKIATAQATADNAERIAKEAKDLVEANNEHLLKVMPTTAVQEQLAEQAEQIRQLRELIDALYSKLPRPTSIDYTHGQQLKGYSERGSVHYHAQANKYGLDQLRDQINRTPIGSDLLIDWEPWLKQTENLTWYGDASEEENLKHFGRLAWLIREATPALKARMIRPSTYSIPSLLPRNWVRVRGQEGEKLYDAWLKDQHRLIDQAEKSGLIAALREAGGYVHVVGYLPAEYEGNKSAPKWVAAAIANQSRVLDERGVPHRWLFRPSANPELNRVMVEGSRGRGDWWEDRQMPTEFAAIGKMIEGSK